MITVLKKIVKECVEEYTDMKNWMDVRSNYFIYSYLAFLNYALFECFHQKDANVDYHVLVEDRILEPELLEYLKSLPGFEKFRTNLWGSVEEKMGISQLYQKYLAMDFSVDNEQKFRYVSGKNSRDILGAYYTQNSFTYEIVKKTLQDYCNTNCNSKVTNTEKKELFLRSKYLDFSCGSGEFLISVIDYIIEQCPLNDEEKRILLDRLYGYDIDPLAVMIARIRIQQVLHTPTSTLNIKLGNPLMTYMGTSESVTEKFLLASQGHYYNFAMGIVPDKFSYDLIVGNPPWEKVRFEEKKFLSHYEPDLDAINKKSSRQHYIDSIISISNRNYFLSLKDDYDTFKRNLRISGMYRHTACGELNTYALFVERGIAVLSSGGLLALIVKASLLKAPVYSAFFSFLLDLNLLKEVYMFSNNGKIFPIDSREEFAVIFIGQSSQEGFSLAMNLSQVQGFADSPKIHLNKKMLDQINPISGMLPGIKTQEDLEFLAGLAHRHKTFDVVYPKCKFGRIVHFTNHSEYIQKEAASDFLPIYEGKLIEQYNNRFATYKGLSDSLKYAPKATARPIHDQSEAPECRYYISGSFWNTISKNFSEEYMIAWRSLTSSTNRRTMIATVLPKCPASQSIQMLQTPERHEMLHILALFNSVIFDYIVRLKMVGLDLTQTIIRQIPVPSDQIYQSIISFNGVTASMDEHICSRIKALYQTDPLVESFFNGIDTYMLKTTHRKKIISEIDWLMKYAYQMDDDMFLTIVYSFQKFYCQEEVDEFFIAHKPVISVSEGQ